MDKHLVEFKKGDIVAYRPYGRAYQALIVEVKPHVNIWGDDDERVWYDIQAPECCRTLISCTGLCIAQSQYFVERKEEYLV